MKTIVADADVLIALAHLEDANHARAVAISQKLLDNQYKIVFPNTAILEAITALKRKPDLPTDKAHLISRQYQEDEFNVIYIDEKLQRKASKLFDSTVSKQDTVFDCVVAVLAEELGADGIFAFDDFYSKQEHRLAQELVADQAA